MNKSTQGYTLQACVNTHLAAIKSGQSVLEKLEKHVNKGNELHAKIIKDIQYNKMTGDLKYNGELLKIYLDKRSKNACVYPDNNKIYVNKLLLSLLDIDISDTKLIVIHENGDKLDNRLSNIKLLTRAESLEYFFNKRQLKKLDQVPKPPENFQLRKKKYK